MKRLAVLLALACAQGPTEPLAGCWLNHSGVTECPGNGGPIYRPTDATKGGDFVL